MTAQQLNQIIKGIYKLYQEPCPDTALLLDEDRDRPNTPVGLCWLDVYRAYTALEVELLFNEPGHRSIYEINDRVKSLFLIKCCDPLAPNQSIVNYLEQNFLPQSLVLL